MDSLPSCGEEAVLPLDDTALVAGDLSSDAGVMAPEGEGEDDLAGSQWGV